MRGGRDHGFVQSRPHTRQSPNCHAEFIVALTAFLAHKVVVIGWRKADAFGRPLKEIITEALELNG
jgi:hypothetical protein